MSQNLGAILTGIDYACKTNPVDQQQVALRFLPSAAKTFVTSKEPFDGGFGFERVNTKYDTPFLREMLLSHVMRIRGQEAIGIVAPNVLLEGDFTPVYEMIRDHRMQMAWAFHASLPNSTDPSLFIISSIVMHAIVNDIPMDLRLTCDNDLWAMWLHEKLISFTQPHRYLDVSHLGIVRAVPAKPVVGLPLAATDKSYAEHIQEAETKQKPVKARKTRKKANAKKAKSDTIVSGSI